MVFYVGWNSLKERKGITALGVAVIVIMVTFTTALFFTQVVFTKTTVTNNKLSEGTDKSFSIWDKILGFGGESSEKQPDCSMEIDDFREFYILTEESIDIKGKIDYNSEIHNKDSNFEVDCGNQEKAQVTCTSGNTCFWGSLNDVPCRYTEDGNYKIEAFVDEISCGSQSIEIKPRDYIKEIEK